MKFPLLSIITFLTVVLVATHGALSPEMYWKSMLPNTPMPETLKDLLHPTGGDTIVPRVDEMHDQTFTYCYYRGPRYQGCSVSMTQLHHYSNETIFFVEKDLKAGHKMNLFFRHTSNHTSFQPREVVKSIPFSSSKMAEILNTFAVKRGSVNAKTMELTIKICEEPAGMKGEEKYCATSLESMIDFVTLKLGKSVKALPIGALNQTKELEEYKIMRGVKKVGETVVVCHKLDYVYAVFLCHKIENTIGYRVPLEGADGTRMKALSICHRDTSDWNPVSMAFQLLKVKPGTVPVCHFLYLDAVMWVPKQN